MNLFDVYPLQPITPERASGSRLWDVNGQEYLDLYGGHAVISIGHGHPHWTRRIQEQLHKISFYSNSVHIPLQEQLAEKLGKVSGKISYQLFLCNSGAEANENALKLASFHTGRKMVIAFQGAFHGRTSLAVSATDNKNYVAPVNETEHIRFLPFNDAESVHSFFQEKGNQVAAVIVEGIQGVGGIRVASAEFLQTIRCCCDQYGAVYIADSVQCGYGRSGQFYSHDYAAVTADIYTMAKGMGNGFPIAGLSIAPHIKPKHFQLGTTFGGNHLACAAALAVLEVIESENLMKNAGVLGEYLQRSIRALPELTDVRGVGLMIGFDYPETLQTLRNHLLFEKHIFTGEAKPRVVRLLPSLALTREEADQFLEALRESLKELQAAS